jgi:hypothetical protein
MRSLWWAPLVTVLASVSGAAAQVSLTAASVTVAAPGDAADVCVTLRSGGTIVAGTQNDLVWDGTCAILPSASACHGNPATGKSLSTAILPTDDFRLRALVLSLTDVDPIPDGSLYCCTFTVDAAPGACCPLSVTNVGASDPTGHALATTGNAADLCVAGGADTSPTPTATPTRANAVEDDGCQTGAGRSTRGVWTVAALLLALAIGRRVAADRKGVTGCARGTYRVARARCARPSAPQPATITRTVTRRPST